MVTQRRFAVLITAAGAAVAVFGVGLIYVPVAVILAGLTIGAIGLLAIDLEAPRP
jgi:hypothetical protein